MKQLVTPWHGIACAFREIGYAGNVCMEPFVRTDKPIAFLFLAKRPVGCRTVGVPPKTIQVVLHNCASEKPRRRPLPCMIRSVAAVTCAAVVCVSSGGNGAEYPQSADDINVRDPFVTADRGEGVYRLYSSKPRNGGDAVYVRKSKDLKNWTGPVRAMAVDPAWKVTAVWAPEVHEYAGRWYLLATLTQNAGRRLEPFPDSRYKGELAPRGTWIFVSDGQDGPFRPVKEGPVTPPQWSCLDGTFWIEKGEPYLVFCHEWCQAGEGRMMCAKLKPDLSGFADKPVELFRAGVQAKGGFKMNAEQPHLDAVTDGPFLFRSVQSGVLTMTWSGCPSGGGYPTFFCESETGSVLGPWKRHGVLAREGGHSMLFHDLEGRLFLCSHHPSESPKERMRLVRLDESNHSLRVADPLQDRPDRFDRIQVNQLGYLPAASKRCFVEAPPKLDFRVQRLDEETGARVWHDVFTGRFTKVPRTSAMYEGDFSAVTRPGDYRIVCGAETKPEAYGPGPEYKGILSCPFDIREGVYDSAIRAMLGYYTWQRCGSRKGWAGVCHQEKCPLLDADGKTVGEVDARGGYHQSCDLRKWTDGISLSVFNLLRFAEFGAPRWDDGELEEELRWGIDHFLRISPKGFVYDSEFTPIGWGPVHYYARPAPYGAQANTVMLFARAARFFAQRDAAYAAQLTDRARAIFHDMETNPFFDKAQPSGELPLPAGTQPWETWYQYNYRTTALGFSQRGSAALELYRTTRESAFLDLARKYAAEAAARRFENGKDMLDVNCGYSRFLSSYRLFLELAREVGDEAYRRICLEKAEALRQLSRDNLGPTAVFQGTASIGLVTHAAYLLEVGKVLGRNDFRADAQRMVDWVLGANPQLQSLVEGIGYNQARRPVFGQFYPSTPQIPGAVLHRMRGEYDMPPVSWLLFDLRMMQEGCL